MNKPIADLVSDCCKAKLGIDCGADGNQSYDVCTECGKMCGAMTEHKPIAKRAFDFIKPLALRGAIGVEVVSLLLDWLKKQPENLINLSREGSAGQVVVSYNVLKQLTKDLETAIRENEQLKKQLHDLSVDFRVLENNYESALSKLKRAIVPKFLGSRAYYTDNGRTYQTEILVEFDYTKNLERHKQVRKAYRAEDGRHFYENTLFKTYAEAEQSLVTERENFHKEK